MGLCGGTFILSSWLRELFILSHALPATPHSQYTAIGRENTVVTLAISKLALGRKAMKLKEEQMARQKNFSATMYFLLKLKKEGKISKDDYKKAYKILKDKYLPVLELDVDYSKK